MKIRLGDKFKSLRVPGIEVEVVRNLGGGRWVVKYLNHSRWSWVGKEVETTEKVLEGWKCEVKDIK